MTSFAGHSIAARAGHIGVAVALALALAALTTAGCGALPDKPGRVVLYDFGPGPLPAAQAAPATPVAPLPPITLADLDTSASRLEGTQLNYRLGYADANEVRPYAGSRWTLPPTQLLRQRLRDALSQRRTVLGTLEAANLNRAEGRSADVLRITLEEFSHYFEAPGQSVGLVRVRATLVRATPSGERVMGQRSVVMSRPAPSADAAGGVKALVAATDAAVADLVQWVDQPR